MGNNGSRLLDNNKIKVSENFIKLTNKGISLVVLIVTIIVIIILVATVIFTLSKNNPIESSREARFKEDIRIFQDELALSISKDYAKRAGQRDYKYSAETYDEIVNYIPRFSKEYEGKLKIVDDKLVYDENKLIEKEINWLEQIGIEKYMGLPKEYVRVNYIESHGKEFIDIEITPCNEMFWEIDVQYIAPYGTFDHAGFGVFDNNIWCKFDIKQGSVFGIQNNTALTETKVNVNTISDRHLLAMDCINEKCYVDGKEYVINRAKQLDTVVANINLFRVNDSRVDILPKTYSYAKLYGSSLFVNSKLVSELIPCYRKSDNLVGLYDIVRGIFFTNQGEGYFTFGNDE